MKILLLHPDDSVHSGPWSKAFGMQWDLIVDLAWAGRCAYSRMSEDLRCPVRSVQDIADPMAHVARLREVLAVGLGHFVDSYGIDWWEFANPYRAPILDQILQVSQLAADIPQNAEVVATRPHQLVRIFSEVRSCEVKTFLPARKGVIHWLGRYAGLLQTFTTSSLLQIAFDKWDTDYRLRRWFASAVATQSSGLVLLPSAYRNVTRTQAAFARMLPRRDFLSVVTRRDGRVADLPPNVRVSSLASYVSRKSSTSTEQEIIKLQKEWSESRITEPSAELKLARRLGAFDGFAEFLRNGLRLRDAWNAVLQKERVLGVLSADENNPFTRLPILLAHKQGIPTVYAEHGALNLNLGLRVPCSDRYLARGPMQKDYWLQHCGLPAEKIEIGAPAGIGLGRRSSRTNRDLIVFFSSGYESSAGRVESFYREVLPQLCSVAAQNGLRVVLKLHPFESLADRRRLVKTTLTAEQDKLVELRNEPLTSELLDRIWVAVTVESSAAVECALAGVPTFLCTWFDSSWWEYGKQFARFGVAQPLSTPDQITDIPNRIRTLENLLPDAQVLTVPMTPDQLEAVLGLSMTAGHAQAGVC